MELFMKNKRYILGLAIAITLASMPGGACAEGQESEQPFYNKTDAQLKWELQLAQGLLKGSHEENDEMIAKERNKTTKWSCAALLAISPFIGSECWHLCTTRTFQKGISYCFDKYPKLSVVSSVTGALCFLMSLKTRIPVAKKIKALNAYEAQIKTMQNELETRRAVHDATATKSNLKHVGEIHKGALPKA
jgi:hypothetical protein